MEKIHFQWILCSFCSKVATLNRFSKNQLFLKKHSRKIFCTCLRNLTFNRILGQNCWDLIVKVVNVKKCAFLSYFPGIVLLACKLLKMFVARKEWAKIEIWVENNQDYRSPLAYFPPSDFATDIFQMDERVFSKIYRTFRKFKFSKFKIFLISAKKPSIQVNKRHFYEIMSFDTHFLANFPPIAILKTHRFIHKNPSFVLFVKSYNFSRILRQIC